MRQPPRGLGWPCCMSLPATLLLLLCITHPQCCSGQGVPRGSLQSPNTSRSRPVPATAPAYASLGPQPQVAGLAVIAVLDMWGPNLLPFGTAMQQTLLDVLNETIVDANLDEFVLLAVEELLPLSGPSEVAVNKTAATRDDAPMPAPPVPAGGSSPKPNGRRLLLTGARRSLLQVLAQYGSSANLSTLPHLEIRVSISISPGNEGLVRSETTNAVNGPLVPLLRSSGINVTFVQLTDLSLSNGNGTHSPLPSPPPKSKPGLSATDIGLIAAGASLLGVIVLGIALVLWRRRRRRQQQQQTRLQLDEKGIVMSNLVASAQADSEAHSLSSSEGLPLPGEPNLTPFGSLVNSGNSRRSEIVLDREGGSAESSGADTTLWKVPFSELQFSRVIGEGSFGRVYLGKWRETTVAIKILNAKGGSLPDDSWDLQDLTQLKDASWSHVQQGQSTAQRLLVEELRKEAALMAGLRHPNIVLFLGVSLDPACMVTEFCARGSLFDVLRRARTNKAVAAELDWRRRLRLALDAAKGMFYLHSRQPPVLHRDLKSANLLVDKHWQVKVADFNLSRVMQPSAAVSSLAATNPRWLPPEVLGGQGYDSSADVYAFGIILWELLTWQVPWENDTPWQVVISVVDHDRRPEIPAEADLPGGLPASSGTYLEVMHHCWAKRSEDRPTYEAIIAQMRSLIEAEDTHAAAQQQHRQQPLEPDQ